ncbi:antirestriction protein, partial [Citrobacter freundii]|uniref:antirestriction protein n=3 Tax=Enterobacterales TaxID=91347 RepID=UPI0017825CB7
RFTGMDFIMTNSLPMSSDLSLNTPLVATRFDGENQYPFLLWLYGAEYMFIADKVTRQFMGRMCDAYKPGTQWIAYKVGESSGFMVPETHEIMYLEWGLNYFNANVSPEAAGIIVTLFAMQWCFERTCKNGEDDMGEKIVAAMDELKRYAGTLSESRRIFEAID